MDTYWLVGGKIVTPQGLVDGALKIAHGRIAAIRPRATGTAKRLSVGGAFVAPGFIDLHVWGEPDTVSREFVKFGTTAFLTTLGPDAPARLTAETARRARAEQTSAAQSLGIHLEGPFVNPARGGALPKRGMRRPTVRELTQLHGAAGGRLKLLTLAPELPRALEAVRWCRASGIVVSLGHSDADAARALTAVDEGATAVTHVFNGMRPFHHRQPVLLDVALTDPRLTTMVILDGIHVSPQAARLLLRAKGPDRIALVTDSIRHQGWDVVKRHGAYYTRGGVLAGSDLTMLQAVRNAVMLGGASLVEAVRMASEVPARLLGERLRGMLAVGRRADIVVFDRAFRVAMTIVDGHIVYQRG